MNPSQQPAATISRDEEAHRLMLAASIGCGIIYAVAFSLTVWGYDSVALARIDSELGWGKLALGLALSLLIGALTGYVTGQRHHAGVSIGLWIAGGGLMGLIAGWMPYGGYDLLTWLAEPRLRGLSAYPMSVAAQTRMWFVVLITGAVGASVGFVSHLLAEKAWDLSTSRGRMGTHSYGVLLLCVPLAVLPGIATDEIVNADMRTSQDVAYEGIMLVLEGSVNRPEIEPYRDRMTERFTLHLVDYDLESISASVDIAFDTGLVTRCLVLGQAMAGCVPISERMETWMDALIQDALAGNLPALLIEYADRLVFEDDVVSDLATTRGRMSEDYTIARTTQRGRWVIMSARFDTRQELACFFRGAQPVVLDQCRFQ